MQVGNVVKTLNLRSPIAVRLFSFRMRNPGVSDVIFFHLGDQIPGK